MSLKPSWSVLTVGCAATGPINKVAMNDSQMQCLRRIEIFLFGQGARLINDGHGRSVLPCLWPVFHKQHARYCSRFTSLKSPPVVPNLGDCGLLLSLAVR